MCACVSSRAFFSLPLVRSCFLSWHFLNTHQLNHQHFVRSVARPYWVFHERNSKQNADEFYICSLPPQTKYITFWYEGIKIEFQFFASNIDYNECTARLKRQFLQNWIDVKSSKINCSSPNPMWRHCSKQRWSNFFGQNCMCAKAWAQIEEIWCGKNIYTLTHCSIIVVCRWHSSKLTGDEAVCLCAVKISFTLIHRLKFSKISIAWWIENKHHDTLARTHDNIVRSFVRSFEKFENARFRPTIKPSSLRWGLLPK